MSRDWKATQRAKAPLKLKSPSVPLYKVWDTRSSLQEVPQILMFKSWIKNGVSFDPEACLGSEKVITLIGLKNFTHIGGDSNEYISNVLCHKNSKHP